MSVLTYFSFSTEASVFQFECQNQYQECRIVTHLGSVTVMWCDMQCPLVQSKRMPKYQKCMILDSERYINMRGAALLGLVKLPMLYWPTDHVRLCSSARHVWVSWKRLLPAKLDPPAAVTLWIIHLNRDSIFDRVYYFNRLSITSRFVYLTDQFKAYNDTVVKNNLGRMQLICQGYRKKSSSLLDLNCSQN